MSPYDAIKKHASQYFKKNKTNKKISVVLQDLAENKYIYTIKVFKKSPQGKTLSIQIAAKLSANDKIKEN
jgi:hypothetical protein